MKKGIEEASNEANDFLMFAIKCFYHLNPGQKLLLTPTIYILADLLCAATAGYTKNRILVNMPPRSLKSHTISVAWPAWLLGKNPTSKIMIASYSQRLSNKFSQDTRLIMSSDWYKNTFPETQIRRGDNTIHKFTTTYNGFRFATSVGGTATGEGADILIVDDPHNPTEINSPTKRNKVRNWFEATFSTRLNNKETGIIINVMQRLHNEDLSGYIIDNKAAFWDIYKIPVISDEIFTAKPLKRVYTIPANQPINYPRETIDSVEKIRLQLGDKVFAAQYMQSPLEASSNLFRPEWMQYFRDLPEGVTEKTVISVDCAVKISDNSDYSVATIWKKIEGKYYLIDMMRGKYEYPELKNALESLYQRHKANIILIEDKASGSSIIQDLQRLGHINTLGIVPKMDKVHRFNSITKFFAQSLVHINQALLGLNDLKNEILNFPNSKNDDIVDSISQFLRYENESHSSRKNLIGII